MSKRQLFRLAAALSLLWVLACAAFLTFRLGHADTGPGRHVYATQAPECLGDCQETDLGFPFRKYEDRASGAIFAITGAKYFEKPTVIYVDAMGIAALLAYPVAGIFLLALLYAWVFPRGGDRQG